MGQRLHERDAYRQPCHRRHAGHDRWMFDRQRYLPFMPQSERAGARWVLVSTAHPAKFREIVEPLTGSRIEMPESLAKLFSRPVSCADLEPTLAALGRALG